jgi:Zn finger protein HypA/HybF involved in hydrogenase expression
MGEADRKIKVRCMSCGRDYTTTLKKFFARECSCPDCRSSKAQDRDF